MDAHLSDWSLAESVRGANSTVACWGATASGGMMRPESDHAVIVGIDGSESSQQAAMWAARLAQEESVTLRLVYVLAPPDGRSMVAGEREKAGVESLADAQSLIQLACPSVAVECVLVEGDPVEVLLSQCEQGQVAVLGSHGPGYFVSASVGSTAAALVDQAPCPVVVVRGRTPGEPPPTVGPVVVGVDGLWDSDDALRFACEEAARRGVVLTVVHTWNEILPDGGAREWDVDTSAIESIERQHVRKQLARWTGKFPGLRIETAITKGRPVQTLLDYAADAQLLVVGARPGAGFSGMLRGSTSHALLAHCVCPVAVVRPAPELTEIA